MKKVLIKVLSDSSGKLIRTRCTNSYLKNNHIELYNIINEKYTQLSENVEFKVKLYLYLNDLDLIPKCFCGKNDSKYHGYDKGFIKYCSNTCRYSDKTIFDKIKQTNLNKYGHISSFSSEKVRKKHSINLIKKYGSGVDHVSKISGVKEKIKSTNYKKYGVYVSSKNDDVKTKLKNTKKDILIEKYKKYKLS